MFNRFYFFLFNLIFNTVYVCGQGPSFRSFTTQNGLASNTVYYTMQDSKGYVWFCTETGVNRYNGHKFETFTTQNGLADNENIKCFEDSKGRIWFYSINGELSYFRNGIFYNKTKDPSLKFSCAKGFIFSMAEDEEHNIWFYIRRFDTLFRYDGQKVTSHPLPRNTSDGMMITFLNHKIIGIQTGKNFNSFVMVDPLTNGTRLLTMAAGSKISALSRVENVTYNFQNYFISGNTIWQTTPSGIVPFYNMDISDLTCFAFINNELWIGTQDHGLIRIANYADKYNSIRYNYLQNKSISSIRTDTEGNIWISSFQGVYLITVNSLRIKTFTLHALNNPNTELTSFCTQKNISVAGFQSGNIALISNDSVKKVIKLSEHRYSRVSDVIFLNNHKFLSLTDFGLYETDLHTGSTMLIEHYNKDLLGKDKPFKNAARVNENFILLSSTNGVYKKAGEHYTGEFFTYYKYKINTVEAVDEHTYYIGYNKGIYKIENGKEKMLFIPDSFSLPDFRSVYFDGKRLWAASHGNGVFIFENDKLIKNLTNDKNIGQKLCDDGQGKIWVATNKGINIINKTLMKIERSLTIDDGLASNDVKDIDIENGYVYVTTATAINIFNINDLNFDSPPPRVYITSVTIAGKATGFTQPNTVETRYFRGTIGIHADAITFQASGNLIYQYRFKGQDNWESINTPDIQLTDLPPGNYSLEVRARKPNSDWSVSAGLEIVVHALWWQDRWFIVLFYLLILSVLLIYLQTRIRQIKKREHEKTLLHKQLIELEAKALAGQMNPHFIFNSLNTIQNYILKKDVKSGIQFLGEFSALMRQILSNSGKPLISLEEEIDFLKNYLTLEQIRFDNIFKYEIRCAPALITEEIMIPPMLIQPLIENAVKHGIDRDTSEALIVVDILLQDKLLIFRIEDNGKGYNAVQKTSTIKKHNSTALNVIAQRLELMGKKEKQGSIVILNRESQFNNHKGTLVEVKIPVG